ncbi:hypothetical protein V8G54_032189 [Vigna mungo]|uniref:PPC domain-containing protein n=1 Tax=Vigna mungo TaxID=3915 RepID=A0AAQ3RGG2_VIGMU
MVESEIVFPSSSSLSSFDRSTDTDSVAGSPSLQKPSSSTTRHHHLSRKKKLGRPVGSKNKPKPLLVIDKANKSVVKPVFIEVPETYDVIRTIVKFARHHQVSIIVLNASGTVSSVTIRNSHYHASPFTLYGPFKLISLTGTYIHPHCSFSISVSGIKEQCFIGGVGGKVIAENEVMVAAVIVNKF